MRFAVLSLAALALFATPALINPAMAAPEKYEFDKPHTQIMFFADHLGFAKSHGEFLDFDGHFTVDAEKPENSSVEVVIKTGSIDMNMEKWSDHLKNADFFNVEKYPDMTFKSTKVVPTGENTADVTGDLTMLGVTKPVTLKVKHNKTGRHPMMDRKEIGFSATAELDRKDWGMTYGSEMMDTKVEIRIEVEGFNADSKAIQQ